MRAQCCSSHRPGNMVLGIVILALLALGLKTLLPLVGDSLAAFTLPSSSWIPLTILGFVATIGGLWLGYRQHGRAEPLAVGMLGLAIAAVGFLAWHSMALVGTMIALGAAVRSALGGRPRRPRAIVRIAAQCGPTDVSRPTSACHELVAWSP